MLESLCDNFQEMQADIPHYLSELSSASQLWATFGRLFLLPAYHRNTVSTLHSEWKGDTNEKRKAHPHMHCWNPFLTAGAYHKDTFFYQSVELTQNLIRM